MACDLRKTQRVDLSWTDYRLNQVSVTRTLVFEDESHVILNGGRVVERWSLLDASENLLFLRNHASLLYISPSVVQLKDDAQHLLGIGTVTSWSQFTDARVLVPVGPSGDTSAYFGATERRDTGRTGSQGYVVGPTGETCYGAHPATGPSALQTQNAEQTGKTIRFAAQGCGNSYRGVVTFETEEDANRAKQDWEGGKFHYDVAFGGRTLNITTAGGFKFFLQ